MSFFRGVGSATQDFLLGYGGQGVALGQELSEEAVGVLVDGSFPNVVAVGKVNGADKLGLQGFEGGEFDAAAKAGMWTAGASRRVTCPNL